MKSSCFQNIELRKKVFTFPIFLRQKYAILNVVTTVSRNAKTLIQKDETFGFRGRVYF